MSNRFKYLIDPALRRLKEKMKIVAPILNKDELSVDDQGRLAEAFGPMERLIDELKMSNEKWFDYMGNLNEAGKKEEDAVYSGYLFDDKHFYELVIKGVDALEKIRVAIHGMDDGEEEAADRIGPGGAGGTHGRANSEEIRVMLPKLELPKFRGEVKEWQSFWQSFESSVDRQKFSNIDKMKFLLSCLEGEAKNAIANIRLSNENYRLAVGILRKKYGDERILYELCLLN